MGDGYTVDTAVLRGDADYWQRWGDSLTEALPSISHTFEYMAFSDQPGFNELRDDYLAAAAYVREQVTVGGDVMRAVSARLVEIATLYEETEQANDDHIRGV